MEVCSAKAQSQPVLASGISSIPPAGRLLSQHEGRLISEVNAHFFATVS